MVEKEKMTEIGGVGSTVFTQGAHWKVVFCEAL